MEKTIKGFQEYLETYLKPEGAKSYLSYVNALAKTMEKDISYFFTDDLSNGGLLNILQNDLKSNSNFNLLSENYQSNVKTGIRSLIKFFTDLKSKPEQVETKLVNLSPKELTDHYLYKYERWLTTKYIKEDGNPFVSGKVYAEALKKAINDTNINPLEFFSYRRTFDLKIFEVKLKDSDGYRNRNDSANRDILSALHKYSYYIAEINKEKRDFLF